MGQLASRGLPLGNQLLQRSPLLCGQGDSILLHRSTPVFEGRVVARCLKGQDTEFTRQSKFEGPLETIPVDALVIQSTNNYAVRYADGSSKRKGDLGDPSDWNHIPAGQVIADAVLAAMINGVLPETSVRRCVDPTKFVYVDRRDQAGTLVDMATGASTPLPNVLRWYKAKDSPFTITGRSPHRSEYDSVQLLMDLPEPGSVLGDIDYNYYIGEARRRININR